MAVAFAQTVTAWGALGVAPQTSGSFTPTASNYLSVIDFDGSASGRTLVYSGSVNTPVAGTVFNDATDGNTVGIGGVNSITGGAQTLTVDSSPSVDAVNGFAREYSGVSTTAYASMQTIGATTAVGSAVTVPNGSLLACYCFITSTAGTTISASANGSVTPTNVVSSTNGGVNYCIADYVGTGGSITPTFSSSTNGNYVVLQVLLTGAASGPTINTQPANQSVYVGQTATFTVSATTSGGSLSYQWQQYISGSWTNVGTNSSSYTTGAAGFADNGDKFQVLVTDSNGTTTSATAILTVIGAASIAWLQ